MPDIIVFAVIGVLGGLMGVAFVEINMFLARKRKIYIKTKILKVCEALTFAFVGATIVFFLP